MKVTYDGTGRCLHLPRDIERERWTTRLTPTSADPSTAQQCHASPIRAAPDARDHAGRQDADDGKE
jgi:hypothetical protein